MRIVYSTLDALKIAHEHPTRPVVFLGIGFETTIPAVAWTLREAQAQGIAGVFDTRVTYVTAEERRDGRLYSLIVSDADGFNEYKIMESADPIMSPAWSPDSRRIAYVSFEGGRSMVYLQNVVTGQRRLLAEFPGLNSAPAWAPASRRSVVARTRPWP